MTTNEAQTWRVECEGGEVQEVEVLSWNASGGWVAFAPGTGNGEGSMGAVRCAVAKLAARERWPVVAILAPGERTRAEVAAERDEARRLLGAAAAGKLPRCETCGDRIATRRWRGTSIDVCDRCFDEDKRDAADGWETLDEAACEDLPYAAALRAAIGCAK